MSKKSKNSKDSNLYNLSPNQWASAGSNVISGIGEGLGNYYNTKAENYYETAKLYNQSIPIYQQIGAQVRERMMAQANQYMNAGVDISQGTAFKVISHTQEQGTMKLNEIKTNLDIQTRNMRKLASSQATQQLVGSIFSGLSEGFDKVLYYNTLNGNTGGKNATASK